MRDAIYRKLIFLKFPPRKKTFLAVTGDRP